MKQVSVGFLAIILLCLSQSTMANCFNRVFGDGLQSHSTSGKISIVCGSELQDSPDNLIEAPCVGPLSSGCTPPSCSPKTCDSAKCAANTQIPYVGTLLAAFPTFSGGSNSTSVDTLSPGTYNTVTVNDTTTFSCSGCNNSGVDYRINTLVLAGKASSDYKATINLAPGNYYIKNITTTTDFSVNVTGTGDGSGTVRLFLNNGSTPAVLSSDINWNAGGDGGYCGTGSEGSPSQTLIYAFKGLNITGDARLNAFIYSPLDVNLTVASGQGSNSAVNIQGAVTARNIVVGSSSGDTTVTYDNSRYPSFGPITCVGPPANQFKLTGMNSPSSYCANNVLTVAATRYDNTIDTSYVGTIVLSTSGTCTVGSACSGTCTSGGACKGTWSIQTGSGICSGCGNTNGYAEYTFSEADAGVARFNLIYPPEASSPATLVAFQKNTSSINGSSGAIAFNPSQLLIVESTAALETSPLPTSYSTSQVAGTLFDPAVKLVAFSSCGSGISTNYTGNKSIRFYSKYVDPIAANAAGTKLIINGTAIANSSTATVTNQTLNFRSGVATLSSVKYSDVGNITFTASDTTSGLTGTSGNIVVKPYNFVISGTGIPGTTSPTGTVFGRAGQPFSATVTVVGSDGTIARSYGKETIPQGILLQSASMAAPTTGRNGSDNLGTLGNASAFTQTADGVFKGTTFTFDEVGSINMRARVAGGSYLSAGDVVGTTTVVGRFIPNHFDVAGNVPKFATGCASGQFTYLDSPFVYATAPSLTVKAMAASNSISNNYITQNYTGSFKKISANQFPASSQNYQPGAGTPAIDTSIASLPQPTETTDGQGTMTYTFAASGGLANQGLRLNRPSASSAPMSPVTANIQLKLNVIDTDNVAYAANPFVFGGGEGMAFNQGSTFYHGRLWVSNAYGSEQIPLNVPMQTQYYNGSLFVQNNQDNCTAISNTAHVILTNPPPPQVAITTTASLPQPTFLGGSTRIQLSEPKATGQKNLEINLTSSGANLPWLQYNWAFQAGSAYENPCAQANFGTNKGGSPSIIYQREYYP